jgi:hypothetical protein
VRDPDPGNAATRADPRRVTIHGFQIIDGALVLRFTWRMLIEDPAQVVRRVRDALVLAERRPR